MKDKKYSIVHIFIGLILTVIFGTLYVAVQQNFRMTANDPQIQVAEDVATLLNLGTVTPQAVVPAANVEMATSLAPFIMTFDAQGTLIASSAKLHGAAVTPPAGVFATAKSKTKNMFTWQPEKGIREAAVLTYYSEHGGGFVLVARSLREIEKRETNLGYMVLFGWVFSLIVILLHCLYMSKMFRESRVV